MSHRANLVSPLLAATIFLAGSWIVLRFGDSESAAQPSAAASGSSQPAPAGKPLPPAAKLRIAVGLSQAKGEALLVAAAGDWEDATPCAVILNRTPRLYQTEPALDRPIPRCEVRALQAGEKLYLRMQWDDATRNAPEAPPARTGEGGDPKLLYKRPTGETAAFADAAAVMLPDRWTGPAFPSLLMGDKHSPASIYYWSASRGARVMAASGRATPQPTGITFPFQARHADGKWTLTMELPQQPEGYPVAFASWDGEFADRDGLKFFSVWQALTRKDGK